METGLSADAWLESAAGDRTVVRGTCSLGRSANNDLVLPNEKVSRRHAVVHAQGDGEFWLIDLGSSNGTYLNGRRVAQPCRLGHGDTIQIATFSYSFRQAQPTLPSLNEPPTAKTIREIKSLHCWLLVADIEGSTQFLRKLPVEQASQMTGRWLDVCKKATETHGGAINKYLGDGFLAYWRDGPEAPGPLARLLGALKELQQRREPPFRVVLHFGQVFMGGAGSQGEENLIGNEVNFVFRMEKLAASLGVPVLLSEPAGSRIGEHVPLGAPVRHEIKSFEGEHRFFTF